MQLNDVVAKALTTVAALAAAFVFFVWYALHDIGQPVKIVTVTSGWAGTYLVGESKESLLARAADQSYSPAPKPSQCQANWIKVSVATAIQRECLLRSNEWQVEDVLDELCPPKTDFFTTLFFSNNKVARIETRCTRPV